MGFSFLDAVHQDRDPMPLTKQRRKKSSLRYPDRLYGGERNVIPRIGDKVQFSKKWIALVGFTPRRKVGTVIEVTMNSTSAVVTIKRNDARNVKLFASHLILLERH